MSRAYRISVSDSIKRHIKVGDGALSHGHIYDQGCIHDHDQFLNLIQNMRQKDEG